MDIDAEPHQSTLYELSLANSRASLHLLDVLRSAICGFEVVATLKLETIHHFEKGGPNDMDVDSASQQPFAKKGSTIKAQKGVASGAKKLQNAESWTDEAVVDFEEIAAVIAKRNAKPVKGALAVRRHNALAEPSRTAGPVVGPHSIIASSSVTHAHSREPAWKSMTRILQDASAPLTFDDIFARGKLAVKNPNRSTWRAAIKDTKRFTRVGGPKADLFQPAPSL